MGAQESVAAGASGLSPIIVLSERELRDTVALDRAAMAAVARAFAGLARGEVVMPPVLRLDVEAENGEMDVKTAYVPGLDGFALKVSTGFFNNAARGLPSLGGMMTLLDARTGHVRAVLLDNGYLTDIRTALAGAIAADHLARHGATVAAIIGTGLQARLQAEALALVRPLTRIRVWGRDPEKAQRCASDIAARTGIVAEAAPTAEAAVADADIVVTTTAAKAPLLRAEWLSPGVHVTAMGSDAEGKCELFPEVMGGADRIIVDRRSQCERMGELHHALAAGAVAADAAIDELGAVVDGRVPGRRSDAEVTVCDLTGTGAQDTAIALFAFERARARGLGLTVG